MACYTYKELNFNNGIFDSTVDVTYILTMTNSKERHANIYEQLESHHPTSRVVIVFNDGYKVCEKSMKCGQIDLSYKDLTHAVMHIFSLATEYNRILVLEDDFIFNADLPSQDIANVNDFLVEHNPEIYSLGSIQVITYPFALTHRKLYVKLGAHAMLYTKEGREMLVAKHQNCMVVGHDIDWMTCFCNSCYGYKTNIYAQLFNETENRKNWGKDFKCVPHYFIDKHVRFCVFLITLVGLDNKHNIHQKFDDVNSFFNYIHFSLLLLCIVLALRFFTGK